MIFYRRANGFNSSGRLSRYQTIGCIMLFVLTSTFVYGWMATQYREWMSWRVLIYSQSIWLRSVGGSAELIITYHLPNGDRVGSPGLSGRLLGHSGKWYDIFTVPNVHGEIWEWMGFGYINGKIEASSSRLAVYQVLAIPYWFLVVVLLGILGSVIVPVWWSKRKLRREEKGT